MPPPRPPDRPRRRPPAACRRLALAVLLWPAGCTHPSPPEPLRPAGLDQGVAAALDAARRDERQKIMQEYWYEHAIAAGAGDRSLSPAAPPLLYPAGNYDGINFAARQAVDPSLGEPIR